MVLTENAKQHVSFSEGLTKEWCKNGMTPIFIWQRASSLFTARG